MIEEDLYRSGQPNELNFPFLEKLGLKTIAWLAPEEPNQRLYVSNKAKGKRVTHTIQLLL